MPTLAAQVASVVLLVLVLAILVDIWLSIRFMKRQLILILNLDRLNKSLSGTETQDWRQVLERAGKDRDAAKNPTGGP